MNRSRTLLVASLVVLFCAPSIWAQCPSITSDGTAKADQVSKFTTACNIEPSAITEAGGKVGIGTSTPTSTLDVKGTATIRGRLILPSLGTAGKSHNYSSVPLDAYASVFSGGKALQEHFSWQAEPAGSMSLLFAFGTATPAPITSIGVCPSSPVGPLATISFFNNDNCTSFATGSNGTGTIVNAPSGAKVAIINGGTTSVASFGVDAVDIHAPLFVGMPADNAPLNIDNSGNMNTTGSVAIGGNLSVAGNKQFQIDDPLDPANKYMYHAAVESSEVMNIYTGNAVTDAGGIAVVQLPAWFEALNGDFRYQLTVIGQFAQAIVASKIANHRFRIKTDKPNVEVSWQVTGLRQDAYAKAHPLVVEQEKPAAEGGYYVHPELFGQPESKRITYAHKFPVRDKEIESAKAGRAGD